jgi:4-hydroxybenzoate polyprenyltransferase
VSAAPSPALPVRAGLLRRTRQHLRLYESAQILLPGVLGILAQRSLPPASVLVLYLVAYASHVLSVYSFNDYCDYESDADNPRKAGPSARSLAWLRNQTLALTGVFLVTVAFMPLGVRLLFVLDQLICMAYSHPRVRLKKKLLGSEFAHFVAGSSYFLTGVLVAGGDARSQALGAVVFGLLYLSGGTFNEVMDHDADRKAQLRHLVVRMGPRRALALVVAVHYVAFALLAAYVAVPWMRAGCAVAVALYTVAALRVRRARHDPAALLRFRSVYRLIFAALLGTLALSHVVAIAAG